MNSRIHKIADTVAKQSVRYSKDVENLIFPEYSNKKETTCTEKGDVLFLGAI